MADTIKSICEKALRRNQEMSSLADDFMTNPVGKPAQLCAQFYDDARQEVLRLSPWTCVAKRAALVANTTAENLTNRAYAFDPPDDFIRQIDVVDSEGQRVDFLYEAGLFFSDTEAPIIIYVPDATDPAKWDPLLRETIITQLASMIAYPLTGSHENELAFAQVAASLADNADTLSRRERRQGHKLADPWMADLFDLPRPQ